MLLSLPHRPPRKIEKLQKTEDVQVAEGDFLEVVTQSRAVVCHFFHAGFERCKILDAHLAALAPRYFDTRFVKLSAPVPLLFLECLYVDSMEYKEATKAT